MSKIQHKIVIYKRSVFGVLIPVANFNSNKFEAIISTQGCLRVNQKYGGDLVAAFAPGEWHVCKNFSVDWSDK